MNRQPLTTIQKRTFDFVRSYSKENGFAPTRMEICEKFGWSSSNAANQVIMALVRKGYIKLHEKLAARNLVVI